MEQMKNYLVCQFCGRSTPIQESKFWLNQPSRDDLFLRIVRCPEHWSEWALRHTRAGRSNNNRAMMAEALSQPKLEGNPFLDPFPTIDEDVDIDKAMRLPSKDRRKYR